MLMRSFLKRSLATFAACALCASMAPAIAFAEPNVDSTQAIDVTEAQATELQDEGAFALRDNDSQYFDIEMNKEYKFDLPKASYITPLLRFKVDVPTHFNLHGTSDTNAIIFLHKKSVNKALNGYPTGPSAAHDGTPGVAGHKYGYQFDLLPGTYYLILSNRSNVGPLVMTLDAQKAKDGSMYRMYNPNSGEHFYTANSGECENLFSNGWKYEGVGWIAPKTSSTPVYRLYSGTDHHYTPYAAERDSLVRSGWSYEGVGWYSDDAKGVPLYRQFNPNVNPSAPTNNSGSHNYTTSKAENDQLVRVGWQAEGVGWYGCK